MTSFPLTSLWPAGPPATAWGMMLNHERFPKIFESASISPARHLNVLVSWLLRGLVNYVSGGGTLHCTLPPILGPNGTEEWADEGKYRIDSGPQACWGQPWSDRMASMVVGQSTGVRTIQRPSPQLGAGRGRYVQYGSQEGVQQGAGSWMVKGKGHNTVEYSQAVNNNNNQKAYRRTTIKIRTGTGNEGRRWRTRTSVTLQHRNAQARDCVPEPHLWAGVRSCHPPSWTRLDETRLGGADVGVCLTFILI